MTMILIFITLVLTLLLSAIGLIINGGLYLVGYLGHKDTILMLQRCKKNLIFFVIILIISMIYIWMTQVMASTPAIKDQNGNILPNSISELRQVNLNGRKEWISIRGIDKNNPVLLFLAGGPGGSQMAAVRYNLAELEEAFVIVNWDQPGAGKSYGAAKTKSITVDNYIEDGNALTQYLCEEFSEEKIYLVGESWGSALGIMLAQRSPELYHAVIGTGQMVAFLETEQIDYKTVLDLAKKNNDTKTVAKLTKNGPPPYYGKDVTWKTAAYIPYLGSVMAKNPEIKNNSYSTMRDLAASEYGIMDKINFLRGIVNTFNYVYPQLYNVDLRTDAQTLKIPVYFFIGRHDINAPTELVEKYIKELSAPHKEIIWFEHSGHSPWINENNDFVKEILKIKEKIN